MKLRMAHLRLRSARRAVQMKLRMARTAPMKLRMARLRVRSARRAVQMKLRMAHLRARNAS